MQTELVTVDRDSRGFAVLTLNRPAAMNALSRALRARLAAVVAELEADPQIRVLILTGAGKAFCAGLDLKELGASDPSAAVFGQAVPDPVTALGRFTGPVIGAINGAAITGGFELALACDVLLASTQAKFADTHARVGVIPGWGLSQKLSRAVGIYRAKELSLSGNFLSAHQAAGWGLVNRVVEPDQLMPQAKALAQDMLSVIPEMLVDYKRLIDDGYARDFGQAMALELSTSRAANASVKAADIEQRRETVRQRGRTQ